VAPCETPPNNLTADDGRDADIDDTDDEADDDANDDDDDDDVIDDAELDVARGAVSASGSGWCGSACGATRSDSLKGKKLRIDHEMCARSAQKTQMNETRALTLPKEQTIKEQK
jgi:hypothetical protein